MIRYNHRTLTIWQHNCNRSTNVMQGMMESGVSADIIAIQEPWIGKVGGKRKKKKNQIELVEGEITVGNQNFDIIYKKGEQQARVMWMISKDLGLKYTTRDDVWDDVDAAVLDVEIKEKSRGKRKLRIMNIYNHEARGQRRGGWCMERMPAGIGGSQMSVILGDMNAKGGCGMTWSQQKERQT